MVLLNNTILGALLVLLPGTWVVYLCWWDNFDGPGIPPQPVNIVRPYCSQDVFRQYYVTHGAFPREGVWNDSDAPHFEPTICQYRWERMPPNKLKECVNQLKLRYIVTMGDSNGLKYFKAFLRLLNHTYSVCTNMKMEPRNVNEMGLLPQREYYSKGNKTIEEALIISPRECKNCISREWLCADSDRKDMVTLENLGADHILGTSLYIDDESLLVIPTYQEFLTQYYFKGHAPDLLIYFLPSNHDKRLSLKEYRDSLSTLSKSFSQYIPQTKVYIITGTAEFEPLLNKKYSGKLYHGRLGSDQIAMQNLELFDILREGLVGVPPDIYGFFNLHDLSNAQYYWSLDGVHFQPQWYDAIVSNILEVVCRN